MEGIIDNIPIISIILFTIGLVGVMAYEKFKSKHAEEQTT
jgi:NADH:ubiquinone oxidoreductase subunit K